MLHQWAFSGVGALGVDGVWGDRLAAVMADLVDLEWLAAGVSAGEEGIVDSPLVAPLVEGEREGDGSLPASVSWYSSQLSSEATNERSIANF